MKGYKLKVLASNTLLSYGISMGKSIITVPEVSDEGIVCLINENPKGFIELLSVFRQS